MARPVPHVRYIDRQSFIRNYWKYYLMLEGKLIHASEYVQIHIKNFNAFSNEYASLQYMIGAELDSFFKVYCGYKSSDETNISDYANQILGQRYSDVVSQKIILREYDLILQPFNGWDINKPKQSLTWWQAYDNIKHSRYENIDDANLKNVLDLLAGLFIMEMKYLKELADQSNEKDCPDYNSRLFELDNWNTRYHNLEGGFFAEL